MLNLKPLNGFVYQEVESETHIPFHAEDVFLFTECLALGGGLKKTDGDHQGEITYGGF